MAFLNQVRHRQAVVPKPGGKGDHQPHMGGRKAVQGDLIAVVSPTDGQGAFLIAFKKGSVHRRPDETALNSGDLSHTRYCSPKNTYPYGQRVLVDHRA
jgi:hypothetical protein